MTIQASVYGSRIRVTASSTFPSGFDVTQFADDADPFDFPEIQIGDSAIGVNGDPVGWQKAAMIKPTVNVIAGSTDDKNLEALFIANTPGKGKLPVFDVITLTLIYADGSSASLSGGICVSFMPSSAGTSEGRLKSKVYKFDFGSIAKN